MTFADRILSFQKDLELKVRLPKGVRVLNPYLEEKALIPCEKFYRRFYNDDSERAIILGINPGRYGGGITGVPFTDPDKLEALGIPNDLPKKKELSANFIYEMIAAFGGAQKFYKKFYISAVSPLGFTKDEKNLNYYDLSGLFELLENFIVKCLRRQLSWRINQKVCYCLGEGKNFVFLNKLNKQYEFFSEIVPLPHPRFIMQYRTKRIKEFIALYLQKFDRQDDETGLDRVKKAAS